MVTFGSELLAAAVAGSEPGEHPLRHVAELAPREGRRRPWPTWAEPDVVRAFTDRGISSPWAHQVDAADLAHAGRHVVISTGTASGKSLAYQLPILNALATDPRARALYLSPTKALGHDQLRAAHALTAAVPRLGDVAPTAYDGDSPAEVRRFARERSRWLFSNPDMVHLALLRNHARWAVFLRGLRYRGCRRMPLLPRCFRLERGDGAASVAAVVCALLGPPGRYADGDLRQRDDRGARCDCRRAHRPAGRGDHRGRLATGRPHGRVVGAGPAHRPRRRKRRSGTAVRRQRGGTSDGRPDRRRRAHPDIRPVASRRRIDRAGNPCATGGHRPDS